MTLIYVSRRVYERFEYLINIRHHYAELDALGDAYFRGELTE